MDVDQIEKIKYQSTLDNEYEEREYTFINASYFFGIHLGLVMCYFLSRNMRYGMQIFDLTTWNNMAFIFTFSLPITLTIMIWSFFKKVLTHRKIKIFKKLNNL